MKNKKKNRSKKNNKNRNYNNKPNVKTTTNNTQNNTQKIVNNKPNNNNNNKNKKKSSKKNIKTPNLDTSLNIVKEKDVAINNEKEVKNVDVKEEIQNKEIKKENVANIKSEINNNSKTPKNGKTIKVGTLLLITFVFFIVFLIFLFSINLNSNRIQSNIYIESIDVSKLTVSEAKNKIKEAYGGVLKEKLKCSYNGKIYEIKLEDIDFKLNIDEAISEAMIYGRDNNILIAVKDFYSLKIGNNKNIKIDCTYDTEKLNKKLEEYQKDFYQEVKQYSYTTEDNKLKITNGVKGIKIDYNEFKDSIIDALAKKSFEEPFEIPLDIEEPDPIDVDKIHNEVFVEVKDAYYTTEPFAIHDEIIGIDFDVNTLKNQIEAEPEKTDYELDLTITQPAVKVDDLDLYNDELGRCSTYYVNNPNRTNNLRIAASKINGYILMPGETFSYNEVVGERTYSAGYRNAAIYVNGEVEDGLAGRHLSSFFNFI